jgi:hypothetical protein
VLSASITDLRTFSSIIERKSILYVATIDISGGMSPVSALLVSSSATSSSLFSPIDLAGSLSRCTGSLSRELRKVSVN